MTDPGPNPFADGEVIICYGGAKPADGHLASIVPCVDDEIIEWLASRERSRRARARYRLGRPMIGAGSFPLRRKSLCGKLLQKSFPCRLRIG